MWVDGRGKSRGFKETRSPSWAPNESGRRRGGINGEGGERKEEKT